MYLLVQISFTITMIAMHHGTTRKVYKYVYNISTCTSFFSQIELTMYIAITVLQVSILTRYLIIAILYIARCTVPMYNIR